MRKIDILSLVAGVLAVWLIAAPPAMSECSYLSKIIDEDNEAVMKQEFNDMFDHDRASDRQPAKGAPY